MKNQLLNSAKKAVKNWWVSLVIGILSLIVGFWCLLTPDSTLVALTLLFIIVFLVGGILEISFAISNRKTLTGWGFSLTGGIIDLLFGILLLAFPLPITTMFLIYFVGFWIMFRSIWGIGASVDLQNTGVKGWGWLLAFAIIGVLFSIIFILSPVFGAGFIIAFASIAFISYGIFRIYLAIKLKSLHNHLDKVEELIEKVDNIL